MTSNFIEEKIAEFEKKFSTPMLKGQEGDEETCQNCGEDLSLETYEWFDNGYSLALKEIAPFLRTALTDALAEGREEGYEACDKELGGKTQRQIGAADTLKRVGEIIEEIKAIEYTDPASNLGGAAHNAGWNAALSDLEAKLKEI